MEADIPEIIETLKKKSDRLFEDFSHYGNWEVDEKLFRRCLQTLSKILDYISKLVDKEKRKTLIRKSQQIEPEITELELTVNSISEELVENVGTLKQEKEPASSYVDYIPSQKTTSSHSTQIHHIDKGGYNFTECKNNEPVKQQASKRVRRNILPGHITIEDEETPSVCKRRRTTLPQKGSDQTKLPLKVVRTTSSGNAVKPTRRTRAQKIKKENTEEPHQDREEGSAHLVQTKDEETMGVGIETEVEMSIVINPRKSEVLTKPDPGDESKETELK